MAREDVTEAELAVLEHLWSEGPMTIRALTDVLHPGGGTSRYATVQKLLERLEGKAWVSRRRGNSAHVFRAKRSRETLIGQRLQRTADQLCEGSFAPLLSCLVSGRKLDEETRDQLRKLIGDDESEGDA